MSQNSISTGSSASGKGGSSFGQPGFPKPVSLDGPETVINPERRGLVGDFNTAPHSTGSSIWNRLFPNEAATGAEYSAGPAGVRLGHFRIESKIGDGGMGSVFRALDERLERVVALKVLSPSLTSRDPASLQRFLNEARAAARLDHDNIARVYFVGEDRGYHFIAHEFVTGRNIRDLIRGAGPLDPREAVNYTLQLATALRHTAAAGVIHRDIKPSNVIITPQGRAKLVDLGLAKKVASESFAELTIAGTTLGTFDYISPEQAKDPRNVDVRSDIYSLGCTLYHMLAGEPPYPEGTVLQKLLDHQGKDVPDPSRKNPRTSPQLAAVVRRMMAPDPRDRYATPDELIRDLLPIAAEMGLRGINPEGLVWTSQPVGNHSFMERNVAWIAAAAALVLIAFMVDRFSERSHEPSVVKRTAAVSPTGASTRAASEGDGRVDRVQANVRAKPNSNREVAQTDAGSDRQSGTASDVRPLDKNRPRQNSAGSEKILGGGEAARGPVVGAASGAVPPPSGVAVPEVSRDAASPRVTAPPTDSTQGTSPSPSATPSGPAAPEIAITENGVATPYATLEAAVTDAKDRGIIELKYNGPLARGEAVSHFRQAHHHSRRERISAGDLLLVP